MEYTGYTDIKGNRIYFNSLLRNDRGNMYIVKGDPNLGYCLIEVFNKTVEQLNNQVCTDLILIVDSMNPSVSIANKSL